MITIVLMLHVLFCFILVLIVLLQGGRGTSFGAAFGGASQTLFGTRRGNILTKITTIAAALFMLTSLSLTIIFARHATPILKKRGVTVEEEAKEKKTEEAKEREPAKEEGK
jgi:preprotein translocase subunit SecG